MALGNDQEHGTAVRAVIYRLGSQCTRPHLRLFFRTKWLTTESVNNMAWLFGSGKRAPSGQPESKAARERQISNLKERVPGLQQKSADSSLYEVQIHAPPDGALVMLRVFLPTKFPSEKPGTISIERRRSSNSFGFARVSITLMRVEVAFARFEKCWESPRISRAT